MKPTLFRPFALVGWYALATVFVLEAAASLVFPERLNIQAASRIGPFDPSIPVIGTILFLPFLLLVVSAIRRDFRFRPLFGRERFVRSMGILPLLAIAFYLLDWDIHMVAVALFAATAVFCRTGGRIPFAVALGFLALCPLFFAAGFREQAESFAIYAYWCLAVGVVAEVLESRLVVPELAADLSSSAPRIHDESL
jgi:hypothetical protein